MMEKEYRTPRSLKTNKAKGLPWRAIFVDTETKPVSSPDGRTELVFKLGWAAYWRRDDRDRSRNVAWYDIPSPEAFWTWVEKRALTRSMIYLFAFNLFFDFSILNGYVELLGRGWKPGYPYYNGQTAIQTWTKDGHKIKCLDVGNFFPGDVEQLGQSLGLAKIGVDFKTCTEDELQAHCRRDVEILLKAMTQYWTFIHQHDLGGFRITAPSQAMAAYRHRFLDHRIWLHGNREAVKLEREAYHGGRVSTFYKGRLENGPYYHLDYNSAYPSVYGSYEYPCNLESVREGLTLAALEKKLASKCVVAQVEITTDEPVYGVLYDQKLYFPIGSFTTTLTTRELQYALDHDHIRKVGKVAIYQKDALFARFVEELYGLRCKYQEDGNRGFELMVKRMLNGISGKWGQHQIKRKVLGTADPHIMRKEKAIIHQTGQRVSLITCGGKRYLETKEGEHKYAFPAIIAHITADLRTRLWKDINLAGLENCFYTDTDSLYVNETGYQNLRSRIAADELGYLRVEGIAATMTIHAAKDYEFEPEIKRKGVPKRAEQLDESTFQYDQFQNWAGAMQKDEVGSIFTRPVTKQLSRQVTGGKVTLSGRVIPFTFPDDIYAIIDPPSIQTEFEIVQEAQSWIPKIPQRVMLAVWNYRAGDFRRARDSHGHLVPIELSKWDHECTELGFANITAFQEAVVKQVRGSYHDA